MEDTITIAILATIFLGAFFDAWLVTCLFVFGEAVFLLAGGLAYTSGSFLPILAAYGGAYAADQCSYGMGRFSRRSFRRFALKTARRRRIVRQAGALLEKRGIVMIAASRFMGPIAWITPPLAGNLSMPYSRFSLGSLIGVVLGVGQILVLGWVGAYSAERGGFDPKTFLETHFWTLFIGGQCLLLSLALLWRLITSLRRPDPAGTG
ncbi:DedA family protein [Hyphomonas sp.]|uniref:DedA family protein n=1 Tax=Hyphomonas sp. TaxID=87 RepID=UPI003F6E5DC9